MDNLLEKLKQNEEWLSEIQREQFELIGNITKSSNNPNDLIKAQTIFKKLAQANSNQGGLKTSFIDPFNFEAHLGYKQKKSNASYAMLRRMGAVPQIFAVVSTRVDQVASFCEPQKDKYSIGFRITKKRHYTEAKGEEKELSKSDLEKIQRYTEFFLYCGDDNSKWGHDDFESFLRKITKDSLELDQMTFELVRNKKDELSYFVATDAATHRIADPEEDGKEMRFSPTLDSGAIRTKYAPSFVQVLNEQIVAEYYPWELCFSCRNRSSNIYSNNYGRSELEILVNLVTWMLYGDQYNGKFFSQGAAPKGILKVSGHVNETRLAEFRQHWQSMIAGVANAWRTPVIEGESMEWIDLQKSNRDMEFGKWQEYLIKLTCAVYKMDPSEINFHLSGGSDSKPMFESNNESSLKYSRDKGLKPLLRFIQRQLNKYIMSQLDPEFQFEFCGLDVDSEQAEVELDIKKGGAFMGYRELRKKYGLPEDIDEDDLILNAQYIQAWTTKQMGDEESNEAMDDYDEDVEEGEEEDVDSQDEDMDDDFDDADLDSDLDDFDDE